MKISYSNRFAKQYKKLPSSIQDIAEFKEEIFKKDPFDSRLKTHKLHGNLNGLWAIRIDYQYRLIFEFIKKNQTHFHSVGNHDIYY